MLLTPSVATYNELVLLNDREGSSDGGDQGILNNGYCPQWHTANSAYKCGRLPWMYNVYAGYFDSYKYQQLLIGQPGPVVAHFLSDTKPWTVLQAEYADNPDGVLTSKMKNDLHAQASLHVLWRDKFYKAIGDKHGKYEVLSKYLRST
jgi:lipopolysaccharide biosynthesis glycosyltransferase